MKKRQLTPEEKLLRRKQLFQERSAKVYRKTACVFLAVLIISGAVNLLSKDRTYSETENRMLAQKPSFSLHNLTSGKFMSDMEDYVTDQFFLRDNWINLKLFEDMALGRRESNGVYIGKEQYLMEIPAVPDWNSLNKNLKAVRSFTKRHKDIPAVMSLVPNAAYICDQLIPSNAPVRNQAADINYVQTALGNSLDYVDLTKTMSAHKNEPIYYKTDHHWTTLGAKYGFEALCGSLGIEDPAPDYDVYPVTHSFSGTLASKSGYNRTEDTIEIYVPKDVNTDCVVSYMDNQRKSASVYSSEALKGKDKYEVFFGGNHARIDISAPRKEKKNLLVFKDSYANSLIPFLVPYCRNITVIDPRYYYDDIDKLIKDNEITDILFLYNVNSFMADNSLADVLSEE